MLFQVCMTCIYKIWMLFVWKRVAKNSLFLRFLADAQCYIINKYNLWRLLCEKRNSSVQKKVRVPAHSWKTIETRPPRGRDQFFYGPIQQLLLLKIHLSKKMQFVCYSCTRGLYYAFSLLSISIHLMESFMKSNYGRCILTWYQCRLQGWILSLAK